MKKTVLAVLAIASVAALVMVGCQSRVAEERAVAERLDAEADLALAEADAYQRRVAADTSAEAARSSMRQFERGASHERTLETLPFLVAVVGMVVILVAAAVMGWLRYCSRPSMDVLLLLQQQDRRLLDLERATYHIVSRQQRQLRDVVGSTVLEER
jgi:hypothetical protein